MSLEANKAIVRRLFDEVINRGLLDAVDELFGPAHVHYLGAQEFHGPAGARTLFANIRTTFPDCHMTIDALLAEGDQVVASFTSRGTHAPTGHAVDYTGIDIFRLADGKIVERRGLVDTATLQQQVRGGAPARP
jgi:ketosteroid isomerase-like protein